MNMFVDDFNLGIHVEAILGLVLKKVNHIQYSNP